MEPRHIDFSRHRTIIVTATDSKYYGLLCELLSSLETHKEFDFCDFGVINIGLEAGQLVQLNERVTKIVEGKWDIPFTGFESAPRYRQASTVTPFLPEYFPGYDIYLWLDSDVWVQDWSAIEMYALGALRDGMAAVPEIDRNYPACTSELYFKVYRKIPFVRGRIKSITTSQYARMSRLYSQYVSRRLMFAPVVNAGVFAIAAGAPHWSAWKESYRIARIADHRALSDQAVLNHALYTKRLPLQRLPCTCNWLTCFGPPMLDEKTGELVEPSLPHASIGLVHVTGMTKHDLYEIHTLGGETHSSQLNFSSVLELRIAAAARQSATLPEYQKRPG